MASFSYPKFDPPLAVSEALIKDRRSRAIGELLLGWFAARIEARTDGLAAFCGIRCGGRGESVMAALGRAVTPILRRRTMTRVPRTGGCILLPGAVSIAADAGLMMARLLCREPELDLVWKVCTRGDSRHLPVLSGFPGELDEFDPLAEGATLARACVRDEDPTWWVRGYRQWRTGVIA